MRIAKTRTDESKGTPEEGVLREFVGYNVKRAYMALQPAAQAGMAEYDLRVPSFSCLSVIVANPGIAPSELAECLKMERSNIVVVIDELESRELVNRTKSTKDRRRYALSATMRGRRLHEKAVAAIHRRENHLLRSLSAEEQATLVELLNKVEAGSTK
ncbi:MAG: transcriptional regulator [Hyphomicrobiales bacterium]|nr:MAG: transcriptional regulator [Hyphomicrobiales bacterium]